MSIITSLLLLLTVHIIQSKCHVVIKNVDTKSTCASVLSQAISDEIDNYAPIVNRIINETKNGNFHGTTWLELANFVDEFGPRFTGTENLENSINYVLERSINLNLENVHGETTPIPHWIR